MAGELGAAQQPGQRGGAVLGGDPRALLGGELAVVGELVEQPAVRGGGDSAASASSSAGVRTAACFVGGLGRARPAPSVGVGVRLVEDAGEHGDRVAVHRRARRCPARGRRRPATVATWAVLASRPRVSADVERGGAACAR